MVRTPLRIALIAGAAFGLSACVDYGYGGSYSSAYGDGYGYGADFAYDDYAYPGYGGPIGYGGGYYGGLGYPGYGYYNNFYYPGTGIYVYDRGGRRRTWNDRERAHWGHRGNYRDGRLTYEGRNDPNRDRGYRADRSAAYQAWRSGARGGDGRRQAGAPQAGAGQQGTRQSAVPQGRSQGGSRGEGARGGQRGGGGARSPN